MKTKRIISLLLVLAAVFSFVSVFAFAGSKTVSSGGSVHIRTGKSWCSWLIRPQVYVKNNGSYTVYVNVERNNGSGKLEQSFSVKPGKTATVTLSNSNHTYLLYSTGNITVSSKQYISNIY